MKRCTKVNDKINNIFWSLDIIHIYLIFNFYFTKIELNTIGGSGTFWMTHMPESTHGVVGLIKDCRKYQGTFWPLN